MVRPEESFDVGERDSCSLIDDNEVRVSNFVGIVGEDKLNELCMVFKNIDSDNCLIILFICAVYFLKILPIFVL
jgi:dUTPase